MGSFKPFDNSVPKTGKRILASFDGFERFVVLRWSQDHQAWLVYWDKDENKIVALDNSSLPNWYIELDQTVVSTDKEISFSVEERD